MVLIQRLPAARQNIHGMLVTQRIENSAQFHAFKDDYSTLETRYNWIFNITWHQTRFTGGRDII